MRCADASSALREPPKRARGGAAASGARCCCSASARALAIALSEGLRTKVLDILFGAEEEFDYSSTTARPSPRAGGRGAAAEPAASLRR